MKNVRTIAVLALAFTGLSTATLSYTINGISGTKTIQRQLFGPQDATPTASYTDLWRLRRFARCEIFAAPAEDVRRRYPLLSRFLALELPPLGSPRWPDAGASTRPSR